MKIGIDIGYGYTKACNDNGSKVIFPSLVAPSGADALGGMFSQNEEYRVSIVSGNQSMNLLIGEAAKHSFAASQVLNREKPPAIHDPLLMTAIGLLAEQNTDLNIGVGLPLAYYSSQKEGLQSRLNKLSAYVNVNNHEYYIKNPAVQVLPQGAGILFKAGAKLPPKGYVGVIDPGTYTTEYLLFEIKGGQPVPILEACGSVEAGIHLVYSAVARDFQAQTGSPLPVGMENEIVKQAFNREQVKYFGKSYSFDTAAFEARRNVAMVIVQKILAAWGNRTGYIQSTIFGGGGTTFFAADLIDAFPCPLLVDDPIFANAEGYLAFI